MRRREIGLMVALSVALVVGGYAAEGKKYGAGVTLATATPIDALMANPQDFVGKTLRVDGVVAAVCEMAGCWMELRTSPADEKTAGTIRIKVKDGEIVFPVAAKGKKASVEGVFEKVDAAMAKEYAMDQAKASAGSDNKGAAPSFQIAGTGAIIY
jgi:hypothetical protein